MHKHVHAVFLVVATLLTFRMRLESAFTFIRVWNFDKKKQFSNAI